MNEKKENMVSARYYTASWCMPCRIFKPVINELKDLGYDIEIIDIDQNRQKTSDDNVRSVPTVVMIKDGKEVDRFVGARLLSQMKEIFENLK